MKFAIPGYAQEVRHLEHGEVPKQIDCGVCAFDNETKVVKAAFKIVNETVTPDEPFGESGEPATLTALAELRVENPEE